MVEKDLQILEHLLMHSHNCILKLHKLKIVMEISLIIELYCLSKTVQIFIYDFIPPFS